MKLYKYINKPEHLRTFMEEGELIFRTLAYFCNYYEDKIRGDQSEGTRSFRPPEGNLITLTTGESRLIPHSFDSTVNRNDIFVFCMSTELSSELKDKFNAVACVEILNPIKFIGKIRTAMSLRSKIKDKTLLCSEVKYYDIKDPPIADWAIPDKIVILKNESYAYQREYRIAFSINDAFKINNTSLQLSLGQSQPQYFTDYPVYRFKIGNLAKICRVHNF